MASLWAAATLLRTVFERPPVPAKKAPPAAGVPAELATRELKILNFYAPRVPERGKPSTICYGVINAERVELDPPLAQISPSISRCVEVTVREDTQLTLRAYGREGRVVSATFRLPVVEPRPEVLFVSVSSREIRRGERFTLCYGVRNAARVRIEPGSIPLPASEKHCAMWFPVQAPARMIAEGPGGSVAVELGVTLKGPAATR